MSKKEPVPNRQYTGEFKVEAGRFGGGDRWHCSVTVRSGPL